MPSFTRTTGTRAGRTAATLGRRTAATVGAQSRGQPPGYLVLGRYRLHRPLGTGGFGTVWMARDERLERDVAVKVLARERIVGGRFEREARAAARLSHPGIVTLYEAAVDDDGAYLVSELVRGVTLSQLLEAGRLSDRDIAEIGIALCDALIHAHGQGVVHRDVKPSNVLIPEPPGPAAQVAKLTDFGVARLIGADTLTRTGDVVGTAAYMAPEQADGREAGAAADLYSLALVLYEALTGVNPIALGTSAQRARRLGAHLPPLRRQRRDLPGELGQALDQALRPRPRERGTVEQLRGVLIDSLDRLGDHPGVVEAPWPKPGREPGVAKFRQASGEDAEEPELTAGRSSRRFQCLLAAAAGGLIVAWLVTRLPNAQPVAPAVAGALSGLAMCVLPGIGWLVSIGAVTGLLAAQGRPGAALIVGLAGLTPIVLMPRRRTSWPLAGAAPALGVVSLAAAWPALAGRAAGVWERAGLGAVGWIWAAAVGVLAGRGLFARLPASLPAHWPASLTQTTGHVLPRLGAPGLLAPALAWGLAAVLVPYITRRSLYLQVVLASAWAAGLASATVTLLRLGHGPVQVPSGVVAVGAVAGWVAVVAPSALRRQAAGLRSADTEARLA